LVTLALAALLAGASPALCAEPAADLQRLVEPAEGSAGLPVRPADLTILKEFYHQRGFRPAWDDPAKLAEDLRTAAAAQGLAPESYVVPAAAQGGERDLLLSDAVMRLGRDAATGRLPPSRAFGGAGAESRLPFDATAFLTAAAGGTPMAELAAGAASMGPEFGRLMAAAERYRAIVQAGGWPPIPEGPSLKSGMDDPRVKVLRKRLIASGDLDAAHEKGSVFDKHVSAALQRFQTRHGLDTDGAVGKQTLASLNVPAEERLRQITANLERLRWLPRSPEPTRIEINIAAQTFQLFERGEPALAMRVVVGDIKHPTPGLITPMTAIILNPSWTVPPSIAGKEILPKLQRDPNYLAANNMSIIDAPGDSPVGEGVDWNRYRPGHFPYRLRQKPGPDNALGVMKFHLSDSDAIYLHDTPQRQYFKRAYRALSHGCIRLEKPAALAHKLLGSEWDGKLEEAMATKATRSIRLEHAVPVALRYFTAWADDDGTVHFREDIYGHDGRLAAALKNPRPPQQPKGQVATGAIDRL
jgi:murein L,D-transpeptidase YcbB/YkuD